MSITSRTAPTIRNPSINNYSIIFIVNLKVDRLQFIGAPMDEFAAEDWWQRRDGQVTYLSEWLKLGFYFLRYGSGLYWIGGMILLLGVLLVWRRRMRRAGTAGSWAWG